MELSKSNIIAVQADKIKQTAEVMKRKIFWESQKNANSFSKPL